MAEFWRGDITLRKLRVLLEGLPQDSPAYWVETPDGGRHPWTDLHALVWRLLWAQGSAANALAGAKGKSIFEGMPEFPWSKPTNQQSYGSFGDHSPEEVADYLDSL